jgi:hypothetical protein
MFDVLAIFGTVAGFISGEPAHLLSALGVLSPAKLVVLAVRFYGRFSPNAGSPEVEQPPETGFGPGTG